MINLSMFAFLQYFNNFLKQNKTKTLNFFYQFLFQISSLDGPLENMINGRQIEILFSWVCAMILKAEEPKVK